MSAAGRHNLRDSCRLWTLWEMLELSADNFHVAVTDLSWMEAFVEAAGRNAESITQFGADQVVSDDHRKLLRSKLSSLSRHLHHLELWVTWRAVRAAVAATKAPDIKWNEVQRRLFDIRSRMQDELAGVTFVAMNSRDRDYYEPSEPLFGSYVWHRFPSLDYEIDESAKCLALERSTASAFHSIRCLEGGIRALSRCLGIPDPTKAADRSWFKLLKVIKDAMDRRWPTTADRMSGDGKFFEEAYAALAAMQNPWRNATMHLDYKYSHDEAKHVFDVVGGFMRRVASRMDEDGEPRA